MPKLIVYPMVMCPRDNVWTDTYGCRECCEHFDWWDGREFQCKFPTSEEKGDKE
ncbi:hypothetical protein KKE60_09065 [Patescibacteria group bacterium]|nr:hypothetical protein [Patescibacteria group bacterium]